MKAVKLKRLAGKAKLGVKRHAPALLTIGGVVGTIGVIATTVKGTIKLYPRLEEHKLLMGEIRTNPAEFEDKKEYNKAVWNVYKDTGKAIVKAYWPAAIATGVTVGSNICSYKLSEKRYKSAALAYMSAAALAKKLEDGIAERYGKNVADEIKYGIKKETVIETVTDKKGNEKDVKKTVITHDKDSHWDLILIDSSNPNFRSGRPAMTMSWIRSVENYLTDKLRVEGFLFADEVEKALDVDQTEEGRACGWLYDEENPVGDNCVDFGLVQGTENYDFFMNGKNDFVYISLNHDGLILPKFTKHDKNRKRNLARHLRLSKELADSQMTMDEYEAQRR